MFCDHVNFYLKSASTILDNLYEGVIIVNGETEALYVNKAYCSILNVKKEKVLGRKLSDLEPTATSWDIFYKVKETGQPFSGCLIKIPSVKKRILSDIIPVKVGPGLNVFLFIFRDVTAYSVLLKQFIRLQKYNEQITTDKDNTSDLPTPFHSILTKNPRFIRMLYLVSEVARTDVPLILCGESGTGKDLIARAIHAHSCRSEQRFIALNCAAFPENLVDAELFGYAGGAFTGARREGQNGKFELAHKGTLFLDEITEMPHGIQAKLLRAVEYGEIAKIGEQEVKQVDVRVIAATNRDIDDLVNKNQFRADLYFRLNVFKIEVPPLRERKEDVLYLTEYFIEYFQKQYKKDLVLTDEARNILEGYSWPGNVRELKNLIHKLAIISRDTVITEESMPSYLKINHSLAQKADLIPLRFESERMDIINTLKECKFNKTEAIKRLGISRQTFYKRLKQYGINI